MDNTTKEVLIATGTTLKSLTVGVVKVAAGTIKFMAQALIDLCDKTDSSYTLPKDKESKSK